MSGLDLVVGIDVGTTKIATLVGEVRGDSLHVVGVGVEPARGIRKGMISDVQEATAAITASVRKAERTSGYEIGRAYVSVAGGHVSSINSRGVVGVGGTRGITQADLDRALEAAQAIAIPHNREVLHVIPRTYSVDEQEGVRNPIGLHGFRLEVETHIITASISSVRNLEQCIEAAGVYVDRFILNPLAAGEVVLTAPEREMGVMVIDIGGGTSDLAIFIEDTVWHTAVVSVGGNHITADVAHGLRLPLSLAESVKVRYGHAYPRNVDPSESFMVQPFGEERPTRVMRSDLAYIIQARVEEIFSLILQEVKRSGYDGLLPAGAVLTGGTSALPGIREVASDVLRMPVRLARPEKLTGLADSIRGPAFSTTVGLLHLGLRMDREEEARHPHRNGRFSIGKTLGSIIRRFLPDGEEQE